MDQRTDYIGYDQETLNMFVSRAALSQPLIQTGDTIGLLIKATPDNGTSTGAGGYSTFFIPVGTQLVKAEYGRIDRTTGDFVPMAVKGQSILALGDGGIGAKKTKDLIGLMLGPNINGQTSLAVNSSGLARGTMVGLYSDTGIFYSTDPKTAWQSWSNQGGLDGNVATSDNVIVSSSGDSVTPTTRWDAEQLLAFGSRSPVSAIVDAADKRGNTPWGMGSGVAGPESGYAWAFDKSYWDSHSSDPNRMKNSIAMGPWKRIQYEGSLASNDTPGLLSTALGYAATDASTFGLEVSPANPLPATTSWTDSTSPKAVRICWGNLELYRPEYARVQLKIINGPGQPNSPFNADGFLQAHADTFGGDAGGEYQNIDHLWHYYNPSTASLAGEPFVFKQASASLVSVGSTFTYTIWAINFSTNPLTQVVLTDTLPSGVQFLSSSVPQTSGPNPLVWNLGTMAPNTVLPITVTVKALSSGVKINTICSASAQKSTECSTESVVVGLQALLYGDKSVIPSNAHPGDFVSYTLRLLNDGSAPSSVPVVITEYLPSGFTYDSLLSTSLNGSLAAPGALTVNATNNRQPVFTLNQPINAGQQLAVTFRAKISTLQASGRYCNRFSYMIDTKVLSTGALACVNVTPADMGVGVGNLVFFDANSNGHADAGEGVSGVTVQLYPVGATAEVTTPLATTVTDSSGRYLFDGLQGGLYFVHIPAAMFQAPNGPLYSYKSIAGGLFGDDDVGEDGLNNTDPPTQGVSSGMVYLGQGLAPAAGTGETGFDAASDDARDAAIDLTVDFGFETPVGLGNLVFIDANHNGHADPGEGVGNVIVQLYDAASTPEIDPPLRSVQTNSSGHYLFNYLGSGSYVVHIAAQNFEIGQPLSGLLSVPDATAVTPDDDAGEDGVDNLAPLYFGISSQTVHLAGGQAPTAATGETGYLASEDDDGNDANADLTVDFGFTDSVPAVCGVGNTVFKDLNGNGVFDGSEGIDGVVLQLFPAGTVDPLTATPLKQTTSSLGGLYYFGNLAPGNYFVFIPPSNFASGGPLANTLSLPGQGGDDGLDDTVDENGDDPAFPEVTGVRSTDFELALGTEPDQATNEGGNLSFMDDGVDTNNDLTVDFGFYRFVGVGNLVFMDWNGNGHYDEGEGLDGVPVLLFHAGDDPLTTMPVSMVVTSGGGQYRFNGLREGDYFVHIPPSAFASAPLLNALSVPDMGVSGHWDDDVDEDGVDTPTPALTGVSSRVVTLTAELAPTDADVEHGEGAADDNAMDSNVDSTVDLGFYVPGAPILGVGNLVFKDNNHNGHYDPGEGVEGVTVKLFDSNATPLTAIPVDITVTDAQGRWLLTTNVPGDYFVFVPPEQFQSGKPLYGCSSVPGNGADDGKDDGVDENGIDSAAPASTGIRSTNIHLAAGTEPVESGAFASMDDTVDANFDLTIDFGFDLICPTITISPSVLPDGSPDVSYTQPLTVSGGYPPYMWQLLSGTLPKGLVLGASGVLSGTPVERDSYQFTLGVTDSMGCSATATYQFNVVTPPSVGFGNAVYYDANHNGIFDQGEGAAFVELELFHDGDDPLTAVPVLEVMTDEFGYYSFEGLTEGDYFAFIPPDMFEIDGPLVGLVSVPDALGDDGVDDNLSHSDNGIDSNDPSATGIRSVVVHLRYGEEPVDSGTETGSNAAADNADNDSNYDATIDFGFRTPCPTLTVTPTTLPKATRGSPYSQQLTLTGGTGGLTASLPSGSLPSGLTLAANGTISGTPTALGTFSFTVRLEDGDGCHVDATISLTIESKVAVGNLIYFDVNANGHADTGEGVSGVTVQLYRSTDTPGVSAPLASTTTDANGLYLFDNLASGQCIVHVPKAMFASNARLWKMKSMPGVLGVGDDDAGEQGQDAVDPAVSGVSTAVFSLQSGAAPTGLAETGTNAASDDARDSDVDLTRDLGFVDLQSQPPNFSDWATAHSLTGNDALPAADPDGDGVSNALEYALGSDPATGADSGGAMFVLVNNAVTSAMDIQLKRRHGSLNDVSYSVQVLADLKLSPAGWSPTTRTPTVVNNGDGTETLTFAGIDQDPLLAASSMGFVRLLVSLDADHNGTPEATATSRIFGWYRRTLLSQHQTFVSPFVASPVFAGTIDAVNGNNISVAASAGGSSVSSLLSGGFEYYVEVTQGSMVGHRWDIDEAASTATSLALLPSSAYSSKSDVPSSLVGDVVAVRRHWRMSDIFPISLYHASTSANTADNVMFWNASTAAYTTLWLLQGSSKRWLQVGDANLTSQNNRVIGPSEGVFARPRSGSINALHYGIVRTWNYACPVKAGLGLVGNPFPTSQSATDRGFNTSSGFQGAQSASSADKIYVYAGDSGVSTSYSVYYLFRPTNLSLPGKLLRVGDATLTDRSTEQICLPGTATFISANHAVTNWSMPLPWTP